ncbi:MAG TPA: hypothetical protein VHV47_12630 [Opitutaceae bacterium]|jgi:hypothetical protein|nr:hypothetical protein [Opitutaceae bacterium]
MTKLFPSCMAALALAALAGCTHTTVVEPAQPASSSTTTTTQPSSTTTTTTQPAQ